MLHEIISEYLLNVEQGLEKLKKVHVEKYEEEILTPERFNLSIRIRFFNGFLLEINEAGMIELNEIKYLSYRYHFQDTQNKIVFRYDNTPHFPNLPSFPHHKHLSEQVISSPKPDILEIIQEAQNLSENS